MGMRRKLHQLASGKEADTADEIRSSDLLFQVLASSLVELVRAVERDRKSKSEDTTYKQANGGCLLSKVDMKVPLLIPLHPHAHHQCFSKIDVVQDEPLQVQPSQTTREPKATPVPTKILQKYSQVRCDRAGEAMT